MEELIMKIFLILSGIALLLVIIAVYYYNRFTRFRNKVSNAWSDIDVQLKRRYSLVPNIVESVKAYASHEQSVLENITQARALAMQAQNVTDQSKAETMLNEAIKGLFVSVENYPQLKANENFLKLQDTLIEVEDTLQMARRYYNAIVRDNNTVIESFPGNIFSKLFGFSSKDFFEVESVGRDNIRLGSL